MKIENQERANKVNVLIYMIDYLYYHIDDGDIALLGVAIMSLSEGDSTFNKNFSSILRQTKDRLQKELTEL